MIADRWEHGSDLHWMTPASTVTYPWHDKAHSLFGISRFALAALLAQGGWTRLWVPSFYCPEVIATIPRTRLEIVAYRDVPTEPVTGLDALPIAAGDAILLANTHGLRAAAPRLPDGVTVIEDHTHDIISDWAMTSRADYCVASLRKLMPAPDGGVVWSPLGKAIPAEPALDAAHAQAALDRLTGYLLKAAYLDGGAIEKPKFREHLLAGEHALAKGPSSGALPFTREAMKGFPLAAWRARRAENFVVMAHAVAGLPSVRLLTPAAGAVPYVATLLFEDTQRRAQVTQQLIAERVYPAVLWALDASVIELPAEALDLSRRVLSVHIDQRYTSADIQRVADVLRRAVT